MNKDKHIPQGYKDSPLGIIPKEWEVKRLGDIADIGSGGTPSKSHSEYWGGTIPWITTSLLNKPYIDSAEVYITEEGLNNSSAKMLDADVLLMAMYGQGQTRGKVAKLQISASTNQACAYINVNMGLVDYVHQYLIAHYENIRKVSNDGNQKNLSLGLISNIQILFPPVHEQRLILDILSLWDTAIEKQSELIEKLKLRKRALMQQLLTGKKRLSGFSGEWKKQTYSSILTEVKRSLKWDEDELYKLISVRRRSEGLFFRESLYGRDIATKNLRPAKTGDFLISKMQIVHGASGLVTDEFDDAKISGSYISLVSKDSNILDIRYYNLWSQMPIFYHQTFVSSFGVHIEKMTFDLDTFMSFGMPLPPIDEQHAIVSLIESINKEIKLANEKLTNYQSQKRGLMQQLLTGKKRITNLE